MTKKIIQRKRPLSNAPGAVRMRRHRELRNQGAMVVPVKIRERDIDTLDLAGHIDARLEQEHPARAIAAALTELLEAVRVKR